MIDVLLSKIAGLLAENTWVSPFLALAAGVIASFLPCSLTSVPLIIGYVGATGKKNGRTALFYSLVFCLGSAVAFTALAFIAVSAGRLIGSQPKVLYLLLGTLMILMALQVYGLYTFIPDAGLFGKTKKRGALGAFLAGLLGGVFSSPCAAPVLVTLLAMIAKEGDALRGLFLMLLYCIGQGAVVILAGMGMGLVWKLYDSPKYQKASQILKIITGSVILLLGFYMFWLGF